MKVKIAKNQSDIINHFLVRMNVFIDEQKIPWEIEWDEKDHSALLFVGYYEGKAVTAARLVGTKIGRVATLKVYRGMGFAREVMKAIESYACESGLSELILNAQEESVGFYKKLGYHVVSDRFYEADIPHFKMLKRATDFDCYVDSNKTVASEK